MFITTARVTFAAVMLTSLGAYADTQKTEAGQRSDPEVITILADRNSLSPTQKAYLDDITILTIERNKLEQEVREQEPIATIELERRQMQKKRLRVEEIRELVNGLAESIKKGGTLYTPPYATIAQRCEGDSLDVPSADSRMEWSKNFFANKENFRDKDLFYFDDFKRAGLFNTIMEFQKRPETRTGYYPTFCLVQRGGICNYSQGGVAPISPTASWDMPHQYQLGNFCKGGCFNRGQKILTPSGYRFIEKMNTVNTPLVMSLTSNATLTKPEFKSTHVSTYLFSAQPAKQEMYKIKTLMAGEIEVTGNHPMILSDGTVKRADLLVPGLDNLVLKDGNFDLVKEISKSKFKGIVYNIELNAAEAKTPGEEIIVAQDFLVGSQKLQDDYLAVANRKIMRINLNDK
ncbi:MAG: Hint domain-containing protein [Pseudomonadota bacterium]